MALSTIGTNSVADSAVTSAKISNGTIATGDIADDAITGAKFADLDALTVSGDLTVQGTTTAQGTTVGFVSFDKLLLDGTDGSATDAGDNLILNGTDATSANADSSVLFDDATGDPNFVSSGGKVLQVVHASMDDRLLISTSGNFTAVTGLEATITPSSASSKILVQAELQSSAHGASDATGYTVGIRLYHKSGSGSFAHLEAASSGDETYDNQLGVFMYSGEQNFSNYGNQRSTGTFLHTTNSTEAQSYTLYVANGQNDGRVAVNRFYTLSDADWMYPSTSRFTLFEIGI
mgnify:FL=1